MGKTKSHSGTIRNDSLYMKIQNRHISNGGYGFRITKRLVPMTSPFLLAKLYK
jgi:hypothetical protein